MSKPVVIATCARADLSAISKHTRATWGERQRRIYLSDLKACMMALGQMPGVGRARDDIKAGWRTIPSGSHVILYKEHADRIEILRVYHGHQDIENSRLE